MDYLIYKTQHLNNQIERDNNLKKAIEKFITRLNHCSNAQEVREKLSAKRDNRINQFIWKKKILEVFRLIIKEDLFDSKVIFAFVHIFRRDDKDYDNFVEEPSKYPNLLTLSKSEEQIIMDLITSPPQEQKDDGEIEIWEWTENPDLNFNINIFESNEWVNDPIPEFNTYWQDYYKILFNILHEQKNIIINPLPSKEFNNVNIASDFEKRKHIIYKEFSNYNQLENRTERSILLIKCLHGSEINEEEQSSELKRLYGELLAKTEYEEIIKISRRAYPDYLLADEDEWRKLELDARNSNDFDRANLALSGEELDLLKRIKFPLFISGRAGSGKSTMLLYAYTSYIVKYLKNKNNLKHKPIFLTYNTKLLDNSIDIVTELLMRNPHYNIGVNNRDEIKNILKELMFTFTNFLKKKILKEKDLSQLFPEENHLTFSLFKKLYTNDPKLRSDLRRLVFHDKNKYDSTLVWYTIRAIIKNDLYNYEISKEDYQKLGRKDRIISKEIFDDIYDNIYSKWYKNIVVDLKSILNGFTPDVNNKLWDDMDLISYLYEHIDSEADYNSYPVIFCDETQDFTKKEFNLLLKIHSMIDANVIHQIPNIPLAFAGDELQTINPTGFRWQELKASFHAALEDLPKMTKIELTPILLNKNYRSNICIVHLSNLILSLRKIISNLSIELQETWNNFDNLKNKIVFEKDFNLNELRNYLTNNEFIIILPVDEGEEEEFLKKDSIFSEVNDLQLDKFYTVSQIKGLEFPNVIVYKFGEYANKYLENLIINEEIIYDENKFLKISYFLNKLYVAVTRAKESVFVFESNPENISFWDLFNNKNNLPELLGFDKNNSHNFNEMTNKGYLSKLKELAEFQALEPEKIAKELEEKGKDFSDSDLLRRAANYYKKANMYKEASNCEAIAFEIDNDFEQAGKKWEYLGKIENAIKAYWKAESWEDIIRLCKENAIEKIIAEFMLADKQDMGALLNVFNNMTFISKYNDLTTRHILDEIFYRLSNIHTFENIELINDFFTMLSREYGLFIYNSKVNYSRIIADCNYRAKNYLEALKLWNQIGEVKSEKYFWAKYFTSNNVLEKLDALRNIEYGKIEHHIEVHKEIEKLTFEINDPEQIILTGNYFYRYNKDDIALSYWDKVQDKMENDETYLSIKEKLSEEKGELSEQIIWLTKLIKINRYKYFDKFIKLLDNIFSSEECNVEEFNIEFKKLQDSNYKDKIVDILLTQLKHIPNADILNESESDSLKNSEIEKQKILSYIYRLIENYITPKDWLTYLDLIDKYNYEENFADRMKIYESISNLSLTKEEFRILLDKESKGNIHKLIDKMWNEITSYTFVDTSNEIISDKLFFVGYAFERVFAIYREDYLKKKRLNIHDVLRNLSIFYEKFFAKGQSSEISNIAQLRWLCINKQRIKELEIDNNIKNPEVKFDRINNIKNNVDRRIKEYNINNISSCSLFKINFDELLLELKDSIDDTELKDRISWCVEEKLANRKKYLLNQIIHDIKDIYSDQFQEYIIQLEEALNELS